MIITGKSDSLIVVLHEIYGVNNHVLSICDYYKELGFDVISPNMLGIENSFDYSAEKEAYEYFINNIGFVYASNKIRKIILELESSYKHIYILGFSAGATVAWLCGDGEIKCDGIIGYYGSRIRDYLYLEPACSTLLIFADNEKSFDVQELTESLNKNSKVKAYTLKGNHGFSDSFSKNYNDKSCKAARKMVDEFLHIVV